MKSFLIGKYIAIGIGLFIVGLTINIVNHYKDEQYQIGRDGNAKVMLEEAYIHNNLTNGKPFCWISFYVPANKHTHIFHLEDSICNQVGIKLEAVK